MSRPRPGRQSSARRRSLSEPRGPPISWTGVSEARAGWTATALLGGEVGVRESYSGGKGRSTNETGGGDGEDPSPHRRLFARHRLAALEEEVLSVRVGVAERLAAGEDLRTGQLLRQLPDDRLERFHRDVIADGGVVVDDLVLACGTRRGAGAGCRDRRGGARGGVLLLVVTVAGGRGDGNQYGQAEADENFHLHGTRDRYDRLTPCCGRGGTTWGVRRPFTGCARPSA